MNPWGGKRKGAGRPAGPVRVQIWPTVLPETQKKLTQDAFNALVTPGELLDRMVARFRNKNKRQK